MKFEIAIMWVISMIGRTSVSLTFSWEDLFFHWVQRNNIVTLSTCESEYVVATSCTSHAIWLRRLWKEYLPQMKATYIWIDNKYAQAITKKLVFYHRSKHIDIWYHYYKGSEA